MSRDEAPAGAMAMAVGGGLLFIASLAYFAVCWIWRFDAPAPTAGVFPPLLVDVALFSVFALHHTLFARTGLKRWLSSRVPPMLERSTYVWIASALFILTCACWRPVPGEVWRVDGGLGIVMRLLQGVAAAATVIAARSLGVLELAGLAQVRDAGRPAATRALDDRGLYGLVRHPIYTAWLAIVWLPPAMNGTRLVFAIVSSLYLALAVPFEERDLRRVFGDAYARYQRRVRWRMVPFVY